MNPHPALEPFAVLIGAWDTVGHHPMLPGVALHGRTTFEWQEDGAFVAMRAKFEQPEIPDGVAIFGADDALGSLTMLYFDVRGVSRRYEVSFHNGVLSWWRDAPGFLQRYGIKVMDGGMRMLGEGQLCRDGATWEKDLSLTYTRAKG